MAPTLSVTRRQVHLRVKGSATYAVEDLSEALIGGGIKGRAVAISVAVEKSVRGRVRHTVQASSPADRITPFLAYTSA